MCTFYAFCTVHIHFESQSPFLRNDSNISSFHGSVVPDLSKICVLSICISQSCCLG